MLVKLTERQQALVEDYRATRRNTVKDIHCAKRQYTTPMKPEEEKFVREYVKQLREEHSASIRRQRIRRIGAGLLALACLTSQADAQQRTFYDSSGKVVGRAATDGQGSTTLYDAGGRVAGRTSKSGETTTLYDAAGRKVGQTGTPR